MSGDMPDALPTADVLYPSPGSAPAPTLPVTSARPTQGDYLADAAASLYAATGDALAKEGEATQPLTVDDLVNLELSDAESLYADGSTRPEEPNGYQLPLGDAFDLLEREARTEQHAEDVAALALGREQAAALLHELQVPTAEAGEIARTLGGWYRREPQSEDQRWDAKEVTTEALQKQWGPQANARVALAQQAAADACKRLPWLGPLLAAGAGNDPALIKHFAELGLRQARKARRGK